MKARSTPPNDALLPTARYGARQAGAALAQRRPSGRILLERCSRTLALGSGSTLYRART